MSAPVATMAKVSPQESARGVCARLGMRAVRLVTFNVNGLRTVAASGIDAFLRSLDADIVCIQETRTSHSQLDEALVFPAGYTAFVSSCRTRDGYSGVATFCRDDLLPIAAEEGVTGALRILDPGRNADGVGPDCAAQVMREVPPLYSEAPAAVASPPPVAGAHAWGVVGRVVSPPALDSLDEVAVPGAAHLDAEGRCVWTDHGAFVLANVYFPNNSDSAARHVFRTSFLRAMEARVRLLQRAGRRVIVTGDFNARASSADSWWGDDPDQVPDRLKATFRGATTAGGGGATVRAGELRPSKPAAEACSLSATAAVSSASPAPSVGSAGSTGGNGAGIMQRYTAFPGVSEVYGAEGVAAAAAAEAATPMWLLSGPRGCEVDAVEQLARTRDAEWLAWERESEASFREHAWLRPSARWRRGVAAARRAVLEGGEAAPPDAVGGAVIASASASASGSVGGLRAFGTMRAEEEPVPDSAADTSWALGRLWLRRLQADREVGGCGLRDAFRVVAPAQRHAYTCWDTKTAARVNNCGSRIDLFLVDAALAEGPWLVDCRILAEVQGSDHAPVLLELALPTEATVAATAAAPLVATLAPGSAASEPLRCASQPCALAVARWPCFATRRQSRITAFFGQGVASTSRQDRSTHSSPVGPSGVGASGVGASGVGPSGVGPSGGGASASPPIAVRSPPAGPARFATDARRGARPKSGRSSTARSSATAAAAASSCTAPKPTSQRRLVDLFIAKRRRSEPISETTPSDRAASAPAATATATATATYTDDHADVATEGVAKRARHEDCGRGAGRAGRGAAPLASVAKVTADPRPSSAPAGDRSPADQRSAQEAWRGLFKGARPRPRCKGHSLPCVQRTVLKEGPNKGRRFFVCKLPIGRKGDSNARCDHFEWAAF